MDILPERAPRSRVYPLLGAVFALGAPLGYLVIRALLEQRWPAPGWSLDELFANRVIYAYQGFGTLVVFVALGWLLGKKEDELRLRSTTDVLTGLPNRREFLRRLELELGRARRYGSTLAVLLLDVDGLKTINDRWGHLRGDAALRAVAEALAHSCRQPDLPARYGGDEFVVLAPSTNASDAAGLAERLRARLRDTAPGSGPWLAPRVSVGIADSSLITDAQALLAAADAALYAAKAAGRDRAVVSEHPAVPGADALPAKG